MVQIIDEDLNKLRSQIDSFSQKHNLSPNQILNLIKKQNLPLAIFNEKLSPLETTVKYLKEEQHKTLTEISRLLNKKVSVIWQAYKHSKEKYPQRISPSWGTYDVPFEKLYSKKFSLMERICVFLKEHYNLNFHEIGLLLKRNERTIWTIYQRAKKRT